MAGVRENLRRDALLWTAAVAGWWLLNGLAAASQFHVIRGIRGDPHFWTESMRLGLSSAALMVPPAIAAVFLTEIFPLERRRLGRRLAIHMAVALVVPVYRTLALVSLNPVVGWHTDLPPTGQFLAATYGSNLFVYWMTVGVVHAIYYARRARERERVEERLRSELAESQLQALRARLDPHFLFNALNTVSALIHPQPDRAERVVVRLSELLRRALESGSEQEVPLREELDFVRSYLEIEQARFEDRLRVRWAVDDDVLDALVPPLLLQPLVENAVRHGLAPRASPGYVEISARRQGGRLLLSVRDDGIGVVDRGRTGRAGGGFGLTSTRERLAALYGADHEFLLRSWGRRSTGESGALAEARIPFRTAGTAGDGGGAPDSRADTAYGRLRARSALRRRTAAGPRPTGGSDRE
jgi:two-component system, LytTR family, sensor kinase